MGGLFDRASIIANFCREGVSWQTILIGNKKMPNKPVGAPGRCIITKTMKFIVA